MDDWKRSFVSKLGGAKSQWARRFEEELDNSVTPVFKDFEEFLGSHDFSASQPLNDEGRRSFKFELAENAYVLLLFRSTGLGTFELHNECFAPGCEPACDKLRCHVADMNEEWASAVFRTALDTFVALLVGNDQGGKSSKRKGGAEAESFEELLSV